MTKRYFSRLAALAVFLSFIASAAAAQQASFDRPRTFDVLHYTLRVSFDEAKRTVIGDTSVRLTALKNPIASVELDAVGLAFTEVTLEPAGRRLTYTAQKGKVRVALGRSYGPGEPVELRLKYTARPRKGVYFVPESREGDRRVHSSQIWTQGQPDEARHWFPGWDFPSDKATTEQIITVAKSRTVIGNGELIRAMENTDGTTTHHFRMSVPHPTYLVSFIVGEYSAVEERFGELPLTYYIYPGGERTVPLAYGKTREMLAAMEAMTGVRYPFNKYDQTVVANFEFGGMENITATTMSDVQIFFANTEFLRGTVEDLVAHEIAHSWFGNNVTCKNWAELWLNEGFATFFEAAVRERMYGRREYLRRIGVDAETFMVHDASSRETHALFNRRAGDTSLLFRWPAVTYSKGGVVIHQLRQEVGDAAFWRAVNLLLARHRFGSIETADLRRAMEETSGRELAWFFDQWVYSTGHPKLSITPAWDEAAGTLTLAATQTHRVSRTATAAYRLPLDIDIETPAGPRTERLDINRRTQSFTLRLPARPTSITADPASRLPLLETKLNPLR